MTDARGSLLWPHSDKEISQDRGNAQCPDAFELLEVHRRWFCEVGGAAEAGPVARKADVRRTSRANMVGNLSAGERVIPIARQLAGQAEQLTELPQLPQQQTSQPTIEAAFEKTRVPAWSRRWLIRKSR